MRVFIIIGLLLGLASCAGQSTSTGSSAAALDTRPAADVARDAGRKPQAVLDFLGVEPGMVALDVMAGAGYYSEVLANRVGTTGRVYAQNSARGLRFGNGRNDRALSTRLFGNRVPNLRRLDREFDDLGLVDNSVDVALTALNFHDVYNAAGAEASIGMLVGLKRVLKPGGILGLIDHTGNPGADNAKLHRLDPALAISAAEAAGFVVQSSDVLANAEDDHTQGPFAEGLRGKTDRFVLKLMKPQ